MTEPILKNQTRTLVGHIGVDRARVIVCDPSYIQDQQLHERDLALEAEQLEQLDRTMDPADYPRHYQIPYLLGHEGAAVVVRSGLGDGLYPVYVTEAEVGDWGPRVVRLEVDFLEHPFLETVPLELPDQLDRLMGDLRDWLASVEGEDAADFHRRVQQLLEVYQEEAHA